MAQVVRGNRRRLTPSTPPAAITLPLYVGRTATRYGAGDVSFPDLSEISALASGDLLIAQAVRNTSDAAPDPASDWTAFTAIHQIFPSASADRPAQHIYFHTYTGTDPDMLFPDGGGNNMGVTIHAFRNVSDIAETFRDDSIGPLTSFDYTGGSTTQDNSRLLVMIGVGEEVTFPTLPALTNVTLAEAGTQPDSWAAGNDGTSYAAHGPLATAGATGNLTFQTSAACRVNTIILELKGTAI